MLPAIPGLLAALGWFKASSIFRTGVSVALFYALKVVLITLFTVTLSVVLNNFVIGFASDIFSDALPYLSEQIPAFALELTGLGAWLGLQLRLPDCFAVILSGLSVGFVRSLMPRVG